MRSKTLTTRELQVAKLLRHGLTNKEIASALEIHEQTAKFHVCNTMAKMGAQNRTQAAARAEALRIGDPAPTIAVVDVRDLGRHDDLGWPWL